MVIRKNAEVFGVNNIQLLGIILNLFAYVQAMYLWVGTNEKECVWSCKNVFITSDYRHKVEPFFDKLVGDEKSILYENINGKEAHHQLQLLCLW